MLFYVWQSPSQIKHPLRKKALDRWLKINPFPSDTAREIAEIKRQAEAAGARVALSHHWCRGGEGATRSHGLGRGRLRGQEGISLPIRPGHADFEAHRDYRARGVRRLGREVPSRRGVKAGEDGPGPGDLEARDLHGEDTSFDIARPRIELRACGAGFVVPVAGAISLMQGMASGPAFRRIDVDFEWRKVTDVF